MQQGACTAPSRWSFPARRGCGPSPETESNARVFGAAGGQWGPTAASGGTTLIPPTALKRAGQADGEADPAVGQPWTLPLW